MWALPLSLCLLRLAGPVPTPSVAADLVEERAALPVTIDGRAERLDALIVRPAAEGRYPLALIANGALRRPEEARADALAHLAHDFAHRGWLAAVVVWRGYGTSTGTIQSDMGTCSTPRLGRYLDAHAADLAAALDTLRARPDVDPAVVLGLGFSIGGMSMLDLAARPDHPLTAVVNISGGVWHNAKPYAPHPDCGPFEAELVRTVGTWGGAKVPALWLYALNDPWFQPTLVRRMEAAYRQGGGRVDLTMLPPFGTDGHTLYRWEANAVTGPPLDRFLRANGLPAGRDDGDFAPVLSSLNPDDRRLWDHYLLMPTERAFAVPAGGAGAYFVYAERTTAAAREGALARCRAISRQDCEVVAENGTASGRWRDVITADGTRRSRAEPDPHDGGGATRRSSPAPAPIDGGTGALP